MTSPITLNILGDIASGKGTQAGIFAKQYNLRKIATGEYSRKLIQEKRAGMEGVLGGGLTPTEYIQEYLRSEILSLKPDEGMVIDGVRMPEEAELLNLLTDRLNRKLLVIYLTLPIEEIEKRVSKRVDKQNRSDDKPEALQRRLRLHQEVVGRTVSFWEDKGFLREVNGNQPVEKVTEDIVKEIKDYYGLD